MDPSQHSMEDGVYVDQAGKDAQEQGLANIDRDLIGLLSRYRTSIAVKYSLPSHPESEKPSPGEEESIGDEGSMGAESKTCPELKMMEEPSLMNSAFVDREEKPQSTLLELDAGIPPPPSLPKGKIRVKAPRHMTEELSQSGPHRKTGKCGSFLGDDHYSTSGSTSRSVLRKTPAVKPGKRVTWGASEQPNIAYFAIPKGYDTTNHPSMAPTTNDVQRLIREEGKHGSTPLESSSKESIMPPTTNDVQRLIREEGKHGSTPLESSSKESIMPPTTDDVQQLIREEGTHGSTPLESSLKESIVPPTTNDVQQLIREEGASDGFPLEISTRETVVPPTTNDVQQLIRQEGTHDGIPQEMSVRETAMTPTTNDVQQLIREEGSLDGICQEMSSGKTAMAPTTNDVQQFIREEGSLNVIREEMSSGKTAMAPTTNDVQQLIWEEGSCDGIPPPPPLPKGPIRARCPLHMKEEPLKKKSFTSAVGNQIWATPEDEESDPRARCTMWRSTSQKTDEITWGQFEQPTVDYFVIPKKCESEKVTPEASSEGGPSRPVPEIQRIKKNLASTWVKRRKPTFKQQTAKDDSPDDILRYLGKSIDVIKEEVRQECIASGMRPQFIGDLYLTRLAKARRDAAETMAKKPEPRVKVQKPVHLDTDLMHAVRRKVKETLPMFVGKNNRAAMMLMADGMFQEMSLDRELDDLAWPHDPLAELKQSGLGNVDYIDPIPVNMTAGPKVQSSAVDAEADLPPCGVVTRASLKLQDPVPVNPTSDPEEQSPAVDAEAEQLHCGFSTGASTDQLDQSLEGQQDVPMPVVSDGPFVLTELGSAMMDYYRFMDDVSIGSAASDEDASPSLDESFIPIDEADQSEAAIGGMETVGPSAGLMESECDQSATADKDEDLVDDESIISDDTEETAETSPTNGLDKSIKDHDADESASDADSALSDSESVVSHVSYLGFDNVPASDSVMRKIRALERRSSTRSLGRRRRGSEDSMSSLEDASSTSSSSSGYGRDSSSMCIHHKIRYFNKMERSWQMPCRDQEGTRAASVASSATSFNDDRSSGFSDDGSSMNSSDEDSISRPVTQPSQQQPDEDGSLAPPSQQQPDEGRSLAPPSQQQPDDGRSLAPPIQQQPDEGGSLTPPSKQQLDEEPVKPVSVTSKVLLFEQLAAADKLCKPSERVNITGGSSRDAAKAKIRLFEDATQTRKTTEAKPDAAGTPDAAEDSPMGAVGVRSRVSMFEAMKSKDATPAVSRPIARRKNKAFCRGLDGSRRECRDKKSAD